MKVCETCGRPARDWFGPRCPFCGGLVIERQDARVEIKGVSLTGDANLAPEPPEAA